jgi:hypothetical protein
MMRGPPRSSNRGRKKTAGNQDGSLRGFKMAEDIVLYRVFIASPRGLATERRAFFETLNEYNVAEAMHEQAMFFPVGWEDTLGGAGRPQELIDHDLERCDYFVLVLWDRWGTAPGGDPQYTSGTEEEYRLAMRRLNSESKNPLKGIVVFFKNITDAKMLEDPGEQLKKALAFRREVETSGRLLYYSFFEIDEFTRRLQRHLGDWLREHRRTQTTRVARESARVPDLAQAAGTYIAPGLVAVAEPPPERDTAGPGQ